MSVGVAVGASGSIPWSPPAGGGSAVIYWDAIVAADGTGDFLLPSAAFAAPGVKTVFVRDGLYNETVDVELPDKGLLLGESFGGAIIDFGGGTLSVKLGSSAGNETTAGGISATPGSDIVTGIGTSFTALVPGDFIRLDSIYYEILSITDDFTLTLVNTYQGSTISQGSSFVGRSMTTGYSLSNLVIRNSLKPAVLAERVLCTVVRDCILTECGNDGTIDPGLRILDSSEVVIETTTIANGIYVGVQIESSTIVHLNNCVSKANAFEGVLLISSVDVIIDSCTVSQNGQRGVHVTAGTERVNVTDSLISKNNHSGVFAAAGTSFCVIDSCTLDGNRSQGANFQGLHNVVSNCVIGNCEGTGIIAGDFGVIEGNHVFNCALNGIGAANDTKCVINDNVVHDNTQTGIFVGTDCTVIGNQSFDNTEYGIRVSNNTSDTIVSGNRTDGNTLDGILVDVGAVDTIVTGNNAKGNTGASIVDNGVGTLLANNKV